TEQDAHAAGVVDEDLPLAVDGVAWTVSIVPSLSTSTRSSRSPCRQLALTPPAARLAALAAAGGNDSCNGGGTARLRRSGARLQGLAVRPDQPDSRSAPEG